MKLNPDKVQFKQDKVPFIGHVATKDGLCMDPQKIKAIVEMPLPKDVASVQRLLGFAQYLSKFLPHLADITKALKKVNTEGNGLDLGATSAESSRHPEANGQ